MLKWQRKSVCLAESLLNIMLKFDKNAKTLSKLSETNFNKENLLERTDLQAAIIGSWDVFRNEIGFSSAVLIGQ